MLRWLLRPLSHRFVLRLGRLLGWLAWRTSRRKRQLAERQLQETGLASDQTTARCMTRAVFESLGMNFLESLFSLGWDPDRVKQVVGFAGKNDVEEKNQASSGLILLTGHIGNWELITRALHAYTGKAVMSVMAEGSNPWLNKWLARRRKVGESEMIMREDSARPMLRQIRRGGTIGVLADMDSSRLRGIFVDFFGRPAYTAIGPAVLARRSGAPIQLIAINRSPANPLHHEIVLGDPIRPDYNVDADTDIHSMTQRYTRQLERVIRNHPEQWIWIHDRWRHRPGKTVKIKKKRPEKTPTPS